MTETTFGTYLVDPATLRTLPRVAYEDGVHGDSTTAHPCVLPNGDLVNIFGGVSWHGMARHGVARHGMAWHGTVEQRSMAIYDEPSGCSRPAAAANGLGSVQASSGDRSKCGVTHQPGALSDRTQAETPER